MRDCEVARLFVFSSACSSCNQTIQQNCVEVLLGTRMINDIRSFVQYFDHFLKNSGFPVGLEHGHFMNIIHDSVRDRLVFTISEWMSCCEHFGFSLFRSSGITQFACLLRLVVYPWCELSWPLLRPIWQRGAVVILLCSCLPYKINIPVDNLPRVGKHLRGC